MGYLGANSATSGFELKKQLSSQEQLIRLSEGGGNPISQPAGQAARIASKTGQNAQDIQKVTSSVRRFSDGSQAETHAFRNAKTNELFEPKTVELLILGRGSGYQMKEKLVKEIFSDTKKCRINIVEKSTGCFELHKYVERYDDEEEVHYEIREMPNSQGIFGDLETATEEAERILK